MKILTKNHRYELANFEKIESPGQVLQFIEKTYDGDFRPAKTLNDGTTNEEVLMVLIDRLRGLGEKLPCRENSIAITKCEEALMWLEKRTADRRVRGVEGTMNS
jgi:hypothetical protein